MRQRLARLLRWLADSLDAPRCRLLAGGSPLIRDWNTQEIAANHREEWLAYNLYTDQARRCSHEAAHGDVDG